MRKRNKIIIHCSATKPDHDCNAEEVRGWHKRKGWSDIGYHYFIKLDGTIENGRPIEKVGAHCYGHNRNSIGVCYAGGIDFDGTPKDTRTEEQRKALKLTIEVLQDILKKEGMKATVHGHNEFASKACPSFNVKTEL